MSVQPRIVTSKQRKQTSRGERLYASYTEGVNDNGITTTMNPRDVYIYRGLDKDLLAQIPSTNGFVSARSKSTVTNELLRRYKQSMAPSEPAYHSAVTMDEALNPPWALNYNLKRHAATPNFLSNSTNTLVRQESPRRLKSAPLVFSPTPAAALAIPEPRIVTFPTSDRTSNAIQVKNRSSSANVRHQSNDSSDRRQQRRNIKSAYLSHVNDDTKLFDENIQSINENPTEQPFQIVFTKSHPSSDPPPPIYIYKKSATWCPDEGSQVSVQKSFDIGPPPVNPHYIHRPAVIAVENIEKKTLEKGTTPSKKSRKHRYIIPEKRMEPMTAFAPIPSKPKLSIETDGVKLTYDSRLTLDDKSSNLHKYFIDGRLYLIKDHRYNVLNNVDPSIIQKYNQNSTSLTRPKYYQTIPIDKYQLPKPTSEVHFNASETFFYNTIPKRSHRYIIHPNFISENLNVNRVSLEQRPPTTTIYA